MKSKVGMADLKNGPEKAQTDILPIQDIFKLSPRSTRPRDALGTSMMKLQVCKLGVAS